MGYFNSSPLQVRTEVQGGRRDTNCILFRFKLAPVCSQSEHCNEVQLRPFLLLHLKCEPHFHKPVRFGLDFSSAMH